MASPQALRSHPTSGTHISADPRVSGRLMTATYVVGGAALFLSFLRQGSDATAAAYWAAGGCVGAVGILSFVRHSVFHRSDAARMGWDYGRRNEFQIEVGLANLAWGVVGVLTWALAWGTAAAGAVTLSFGLYMLGAALVHVGNLRHRAEGERHDRLGATIAGGAFAIALMVAGASTLAA